MANNPPELQDTPSGPPQIPPEIPLHRVAAPGDLLHLEPARLAALIAAAERRYPRAGIALADCLSRRWRSKASPPRWAGPAPTS